MKVMIMEDEPSNVKRICRLLKLVDGDISIVAVAESIEESTRFSPGHHGAARQHRARSGCVSQPYPA